MTLLKYLRLPIVTLVFALLSSLPSFAAQANFSWLPNNVSDGTVGYVLHYGTSSHVYTKSIDVGSPAPVGGRIYANAPRLVSEQTYFFTVTAYNAKSVESAYSNEVAYTTPSEVVPGFAIRINAGGGTYTDANGNVWSADYGYNTGNKSTTTVSIGGTSDDSLFQTQRWDAASGDELTYSVDVPDGDYVVNLYFVEVYNKVFYPNGRVFDILLEGNTVEYKMDVYHESGENNALVKSYNVTVVGGKLNLKFLHGIENPTISAIEVLSVTGKVSDPVPPVSSGNDISLRVNAGGGKYTDGNGNVWSADYGYNTGNKAATTVAIDGTSDDSLFQTQRWDSASGEELSYGFDVPDGKYVVNLYFAETYSGAFRSGGREFDILLEGSYVDHNLDVYSEAGKNTAYMISYNVTVVGGQLNLKFLHGIENPFVSAIEIFSY